MKQYRVIAGPYRIAHRYAQTMGWAENEFVIVVRGHQLARLDPAQISAIITIKLHTMAARVITDLRDAIDQVRTLWPVPMQTAA